MSKISALGSGLDSLIKLSDDEDTGVKEVSIHLVKPNPYQPRTIFNQEAIDELCDSIKSCGVLQPILVEEGLDGGYIIIAGERRYRASLQANLSVIPVIVKNLTEEEKLEISLVENIQREDLTPIEEAKAYKKLMDSLSLNQDEVAIKVGKKRSTISNAIRLLKLPDDLQTAINTGELSAGHGRALLSVESQNIQRSIFNRIKDENLSVRAVEKLISEHGKEKSETKEKYLNPDVQNIEQQFIDVFGTKVQLKGNLSKGKIEITYFSQDDLSRILEIVAK